MLYTVSVRYNDPNAEWDLMTVPITLNEAMRCVRNCIEDEANSGINSSDFSYRFDLVAMPVNHEN